jgi:deoxyribodipyrimidine photo-lyase
VSDDILTLVWFKRDLRVLDHAPLTDAAEIGRVLPVYVIEPEVIEAADFDALHWDFIRESLIDLNASLEELGVSLFIQQGEVCDVFRRLHQRFGFSRISAHEETGNALSYRRDRRLANWAQAAGVALKETPQNGVVRHLEDRDGWSKVWESRMSQAITLPARKIGGPMLSDGDVQIPSSESLGLIRTERVPQLQGGESDGMRVLESFAMGRGSRYHR